MTDPIPLHTSDGVVAAYYCPKCLTIGPPHGPTLEKRMETAREKGWPPYCCEPRPCPECGEPIEPRAYCRPCSDRKQRERDERDFEKARKVEGVYENWVTDGDGWWSCVEDYLEHCECRDIEPRAYLWGSVARTADIDAEDLLYRVCEEAFDGFMPDGWYEMKEAIERFNTTQKACWYEEDRGVAVIVRDLIPGFET